MQVHIVNPFFHAFKSGIYFTKHSVDPSHLTVELTLQIPISFVVMVGDIDFEINFVQ
jgi:hypothetical protein